MHMASKMVRTILFLALIAAAGGSPAPASAVSPITVTTTLDVIADDGLCSLREAVIAANTNNAYSNCASGSAGEDSILVDPAISLPATFTLALAGKNENYAASGDLDVREALVISGAGSASTIIDGNLSDRVFEVHPGSGQINRLTLNGVTIQHGDPGSGAEGGGILVDLTGRLTLNDSLVTNNAAATCAGSCGGGIKSYGQMIINNSSVTANQGGGVVNDGGLMTLTNVNVGDNVLGSGVANLGGGFLQFNGGSVIGNQGGGILNKSSTAKPLAALTVSGNSLGGGIHNDGLSAKSEIHLSGSLVSGNSGASGAGIFNEGINAAAKISEATVSNNTSNANGGGINNTGTLILERSTLDHNQAVAGGGIDHNGSTLALTNVTLSQNSASDNGGGLYNRSSVTLLNVTLYANAASGPETGGNLYNDGDTASAALKNTIIAGAGAGGNCTNNFGVLASQGYNLEDADLCGLHAAGDLVNIDPLLGALQNNGGPTPTHLPGMGSAAIDGGTNTGCPLSDQRGVLRPVGSACDIGAVEAGGSVASADLSLTLVEAVDPIMAGTNIVYTAAVSNNGPDSAANVILTVTLPPALLFVSVAASQGNCGHAGGVVACDFGSIVSAGQASAQIIARARLFGPVVSTASVSAATADPNPANNSASQSTSIIPLRLFLPALQCP